MSSVNSTQELKNSLEANEDEIKVENPELSKTINRFKGIAPFAIGTIIASIVLWPFTVLGVAIGLLAGGAWIGNNIAKMLTILGGEQSRKLYYSYKYSTDAEKKIFLRKNFKNRSHTMIK
jgi:hypothetical protein